MKVNIQVNNNKLILDDVDPQETIEAIKDLLFGKFKDTVSAPLPDNPLIHSYLTIHHLRLLYKGKQLPKLSTLQEHGYKEDDTLLLFISQKQQEDPQDDKNEIIHSTIGNEEKSLKYTLKMKNDHKVAEAPDAEMLEVLPEDELNKLLKRLPYGIPEDETAIKPPKFDREAAVPKKAKKISALHINTKGTLGLATSVLPPVPRVLPLSVESYTPVSQIHFDTPVRVKFNQPMMAISDFDRLQTALPVPVTIRPEVVGDWKWSDPFTAVFTPKGNQFPKSTHYVCTVKGEITSAIGGVMRDPVEWSFSTAPLGFVNRRISFSGKHVQVLVMFNQPIDIDKIFKSLIVVTTDDEILDCRKLDATTDEAKLHYTIKKAIEGEVKPGEYIVFEIEDDINGIGQKNSKPIEVEVCFSPAILDIEKALAFKFKTVGALQVKPVEKYDKRMKPVEWLTSRNLIVYFTNPLIPMSPSEVVRYVEVSPPISDMKLSVDNESLSISGTKKSRDYTVTIKKGIMDAHAQALEEDAKLIFHVTAPTHPQVEIAYQRAVANGYHFPNYRSSFIHLDPSLPPVLHVSTVNVRSLDVRAYSITSLLHYKHYTDFIANTAKHFPFLHEEVWRKSFDVVPQREDDSKAWHLESRTSIDLAKAFGCGDIISSTKSKESQVVLVISADDTVAPVEAFVGKKLWVNWSDVGLHYVADGDTIYGWSHSLLTGEPLNCNMYLCNNAGITLPLEKLKDAQVGGAFMQAKGTEKSAYKLLIAKYGNRTALVRFDLVRDVEGMFNAVHKQKFIWHVVDDRARYRPFDRVHIRGMIRERDDVSGKILLPKESPKLEYSVYDSRNKLIANKIPVEVKSSYCFSFDFELPGTINLGLTTVSFTWGNSTYSHSFDVQEYKRQAFNMVLAKDKTALKSDEPLLLTSYAQSFTNEVLSGTSSSWSVSVDPASYSPAGLSAYKFGLSGTSSSAKLPDRHSWESPKNHSGKHLLSVAVEQIQVPVVVSVSCTLKDSNTNEELNASDRVVVHPTNVYVGLKNEQQFINFGEPYKFFAVTCTPDGKFTGDCSLQMFVRGTPFETFDGEVLPPDTAVVDTTLTPSDVGPIEFSFEPKFRGKHSITLVATDLDGRASSTSAEFWVYGAQTTAEREYEDAKKKEKEKPIEKDPLPHIKSTVDYLKLVLDKENARYEPGSVAEVLIVAPFWPAQGTYYLHKNGKVIKAERFYVTELMTRIKIEVTEDFLPKVSLGVVLTGMQPRTPISLEGESTEPEQKRAKKEDAITESNSLLKPSEALGTAEIKVSYEHKKLGVSISSTDEKNSSGFFLPGEEVSVDVKVVGPDGKPVDGAEVTMVVVDEAVLALTGYKLDDPRDVFYKANASMVQHHSNFNSIILTRLISKPALPPSASSDGAKFITIQYFSGRVLRFEVDNSLPVAKLRGLIQDRDGLPPVTQRLLYNGKQLTDEGTLENQGVPNGATINLVLRLFGGGLGDDKVDPDDVPPPIRIRTNMNALAYFGPHLKTNEHGKLTTTFTLPDSLTRYRVMAIANTVDRFGTGESSLIASLPLMIRQAPPRFLNFGDECVMPVVVQNERDAEKEVIVGIRGANVEIVNPGWKFKIPARGRISVPFTFRPKGPGKSIFQVAASDTKLTTSDAAMFNINVHSPTTLECVSVTGAVDGDNVVVQPIASFSDGANKDSGDDGVLRSVGGMEVSVASTLFQELTDSAFEQLSSKLISFVVFKDMLPLIHKRKRKESDKDLAPTPENIGTLVKEIINTLADRKDSQGNFGYWEKNGRSYDYASVFVYHALAFAHDNNFEVPPSLLASARTFLRAIINKYTQPAVKEEKEVKESLSARTIRWARRNTVSLSSAESDYDRKNDSKHALACYAMYVLSLLAGPEGKSEEASKMLARRKLENTPTEIIAWLLPTILGGKKNFKATKRPVWDYITNSITQTGNTAHFVQSVTNNEDTSIFLHSDVRCDAVALFMLLETDSQHPAIPKLVRGLMDLRKNGYWYNTQDNAFSQIAMHKYFKLFEEFSSYEVDMWVGKGHAMHTEFNGVSTDTHAVEVPMTHLIDEGDSSVTFAKRGQGRMYYRIAVEYAPKALFLPPRDCGFKITRSYHAVSDVQDLEHSVDDQGRSVCTIKAGAKVLVKIVMVAESVRSHVALVDYLPAGLEPQNVNAKRSGTNTGFSYVYRFWDHQNFRDSRVEVFVDCLYPGLYEYAYPNNRKSKIEKRKLKSKSKLKLKSKIYFILIFCNYTVKAFTKGTFIVPPTKAEEMYSPEVWKIQHDDCTG